MAKKIKELKNGDVFFIHITKNLKYPCTFIEMKNSVGPYAKIHYMVNGRTSWACFSKKFKDKPASISITADDSKEAYMEMLNAREASFFCARNRILRTKYSPTS
jgi:hypothetical protein